jgi:hypothetical protein
MVSTLLQSQEPAPTQPHAGMYTACIPHDAYHMMHTADHTTGTPNAPSITNTWLAVLPQGASHTRAVPSLTRVITLWCTCQQPWQPPRHEAEKEKGVGAMWLSL